jgi:UDP-GlcNAc3NAcA epimerase
MKVISILGARPQFIKAFPVSRKLRESGHQEILIHTGQHYDYRMSQIFFDELGMPKPDLNLGVGSGSHGKQTGQMLVGIEKALLKHKPDYVLVYGDTNSTLAGALAASKLHIPSGHVEAGLRSFNRVMPEEINRVLADHCSDLLFCPTQTAAENLKKEGITQGVHLVGDTMLDALLHFVQTVRRDSRILENLGIKPKKYLLATVHRPYNTDDRQNLENILSAFSKIDETIIFPVHPRTRKKIKELNKTFPKKGLLGHLRMIEPVGYLDMLILEQNARLILTDSGGVQKEAYFFGVPCLTLRPETEWIETVEAGWNVVVGSDRSLIVNTAKSFKPPAKRKGKFGDGRASEKILFILEAALKSPLKGKSLCTTKAKRR